MAARGSAPGRPISPTLVGTIDPELEAVEMNAVLSSAAILLTFIALLRVGVAFVSPILLSSTVPSETSPQLSGRRSRR